ncbi:helix-turn-helix transcriptional regulator [Streptomyces sp. NPDC046275]|uniref:helix-turn-helix domain-containing protein n=1 Tax=Streptomyces sp. NPDC046275 TaxID=3157201 RepID=UPI0033CC411A
MTNKRATKTLNRRRVGAQLRRWREAAGFTSSKEAATALGWTQVNFSRIEQGVYNTTAGQVRELAALYKVTDPEVIEEVIRAAEDPYGTGWWSAYRGKVSQALLDFIALESEAKSIRVQHPAVIPGLLQVPGYVREMVKDEANRDQLAAVRLARQEVLGRTDTPVGFHALISEAALYHRFPDRPEVMKEHLRRLLEVSDGERIAIQIVPLDAPAFAAANQAMTVLEFRKPWEPVVSIDDSLGGSLVEDAAKVTRLDELFYRVADMSLPADKSRDLIKAHLEDKF